MWVFRMTTTAAAEANEEAEDVTAKVDLLFWIVWALVSVIFFLAACSYFLYDKIYANEREFRKGFETVTIT